MIFLDNASTTKMHDEVIEVINETNKNNYYNPSSLYGPALNANSLIENARTNIVKLLGGSFSDSLIFTSGASEANNLALRGTLKKGGKLLVSMGEHPSIYNTAKQLKLEGFNVEFVELNNDGTVSINDLMSKIENTTVVSLIHVNNETGAINDIKKITSLIKQYNKNIIVHSDGVQAFGKINVNVSDLGVDLYTISAHKIHGPKGVGALFTKKGVKVKPLIFGGEQENGFRAGTQNISGIVGLEKASEIAVKNANSNFNAVKSVKETLINELNSKIENIKILNNFENVSPYITVIAIENVKSETMLHMLETKGILVGNGSACSSKHTDNRILSAMGVNNKLVEASLRISLSINNTNEDVIEFVNNLYELSKQYLKTILKLT